YYLGVIHRTQHRLAEARAEFQTAIKLNPQNARAFGNLAFVLEDSGDLTGAEENLRRAVALNPTDPLARRALQEILEQKAGRPAGKP
ncbi:MAG TPA: tetratricopeptide repeat protein, partial [Verrucomicrobiae bacterium]|nr:tetratricopeptide repeat protein [Verrucomicrobiae bacterium]